jgi:uncharacterized membrane protein YbhN (UPF0104 family)/tRNA A-37 threonylcarbamoyl transferase component Bud32
VTTGEKHSATDLLLSVTPKRWAPIIFGVVPEGARRRRPGDIVRVLVAALIVTVTAIGAHDLARSEHRLFDLLADLPDWFRTSAQWCYWLGSVGAVVVLVVALLFARRFGLVLMLLAAGTLAGVFGFVLRELVDAQSVRAAAGMKVDGTTPAYPVVLLAAATTVLLVIGPYLLRPARRLLFAAVAVAAIAAVVALVGLPDDVAGSVALGWGVAAMFHLVTGTPAATPSLDQIAQAILGLGVVTSDPRLSPAQVWGETRLDAVASDGSAVSVEVIGRDAADARLIAKLWRAVWYKDSGPTVSLTRMQQLEHRAYLLLLAERAGVPVSEVVIAGIAGPREIAVLILRQPVGVPLTQLDATAITDEVLDDAWRNVTRLHAARIAHGSLRADNVLLRGDGTTAIVDFAFASSAAPPERSALDSVELLVTTAAIVGADRAIAAADRALGHADLAEVLHRLEPAALSTVSRHQIAEVKPLLAELRERGSAITGEEIGALVELRRVSPGSLLMAAGAILGVYLLVGELADVDFAEVFSTAIWGWVAVAFLLSPMPQFTGAVSMLGAVSAPLPFRPVVAEQFANNFTGLVGGTVATTALVIRFFQKQGLKVAVAVSSGVLNSTAGVVVQAVLVVIGLLATGSSFTWPSNSGLVRLVLIGLVALGIALTLILVLPRLRRRARDVIAPQWTAARENLREILTTPRKAAMLFGGNLGSQILFALVLEAALHAYGWSLPLLQIVVINSFASVVGGMAPVPGGMGVVEAGLIAGFTAAGVPEAVAVATTFTARLFTSYLPPIWGYFSLEWLRRHEYV